MQTRSLLGVLFFIANGVEVPAEDDRAGVVTTTVSEAEEPVDWAAITGDVLLIRSISSQPDRARIAVAHRGRWFFIDDTDARSKSTFVLVTQLYAPAGRSTDGGRADADAAGGAMMARHPRDLREVPT